MSQSNVCEPQWEKCSLRPRTHLINEWADSRIGFGYKPKPPLEGNKEQKSRDMERVPCMQITCLRAEYS